MNILGLLILAAVIGVIALITRLIPKKGPWRAIFVIAITLFLVIAALGPQLSSRRHKLSRISYISACHNAVEAHYEDGSVPETLDELIQRSPELKRQRHPAHYLRPTEPGMVYMVFPSRENTYWQYLILKDDRPGFPKWGTEEEMATILEEDDRKRAEAGDPGRWADINWRE
jgi:hypothetical protein